MNFEEPERTDYLLTFDEEKELRGSGTKMTNDGRRSCGVDPLLGRDGADKDNRVPVQTSFQ